jgi:formamidopyrimidine-DNA glycosylase
LIIHLKMSGQLAVAPADAPDDPHTHTVFVLASGQELRFRDPRKFGRVYLVRDPAEVLGPLGPEPLSAEFSPEWLRARLQARRRVLKPLLLDQTFLAGIGNIYADEALYRAQLRPTRHANTLTAAESDALYAAIREALETGIAREGASITASYRKPDGSPGQMQDEFVAYGQAGQVCHRCGGTIERIVLGGRSTFYCGGCQR